MGPYFSKHVEVHIADSEENVYQRLQTHKLTRQGLPPFFGGTWNGFDNWLISEKCALSGSVDLDALVRNTLWAYTETVSSSTPCQDTTAAPSKKREPVGVAAAEESLIQDRKTYAHFDIRDYSNEQHRGMSPEERESILRDIYGTTDVQFTVTKEVEMEGRARQQFEE